MSRCYRSAAFAVAFVALLACGLGPPGPPVPTPSPSVTLVPPSPTSPPMPVDVCHVSGQVLCALDPRVDPKASVVQLRATICSGHWSKMVRPPSNITGAWKAEEFIDLARPIDTTTGQPIVSYSQAEGDHRMAISLGGDPGAYLVNGKWEETSQVEAAGLTGDLLPLNFSLEYPASPNPKDKPEVQLHDQVCAGSITLAAAQQQLAQAWLAPFPGYLK